MTGDAVTDDAVTGGAVTGGAVTDGRHGHGAHGNERCHQDHGIDDGKSIVCRDHDALLLTRPAVRATGPD